MTKSEILVGVERSDSTHPPTMLVNTIANLIYNACGGDIDKAAYEFFHVVHKGNDATLPKIIEYSIRNAYELCGMFDNAIVPLWTYAYFLYIEGELEAYCECNECTPEDVMARLKELCHEFYNQNN